MSALGRGRALKSVKKQHYEVAKAEAKGRLEGEAEAQRKKPIDVSIKEHIGKFLDKLDADGVIMLSTWIATAVMVKTMIHGADEIKNNPNLQRIATFATLISPVLIPFLPWILSKTKPAEEAAGGAIEISESGEWVLSFIAAGLIMKGLVDPSVGVVKLAASLLA